MDLVTKWILRFLSQLTRFSCFSWRRFHQKSNFRIDKSKHNEYLPSETTCLGGSEKSRKWMIPTRFQWRNTVFEMCRYLESGRAHCNQHGGSSCYVLSAHSVEKIELHKKRALKYSVLICPNCKMFSFPVWKWLPFESCSRGFFQHMKLIADALFPPHTIPNSVGLRERNSP